MNSQLITIAKSIEKLEMSDLQTLAQLIDNHMMERSGDVERSSKKTESIVAVR
jgi:hypothetical protein